MDRSINKHQGQPALRAEKHSNLQPVDQPESLKQIAYRALHQAILSGELHPGEVYREKELATRLRISRTPVREALLELAAKDLVVFLPRKGVKINHFDLRDLNEIFELRKALELAGVEKIAATVSDQDIEKLNRIMAKQRRCAEEKDILEFLHFDRQFHTLIIELTDNKRLVDNLEAIRDLVQVMGSHALASEDRLMEVVHEHEAIVEAISRKNPKSAREKMEYHIEKTRQKAEAMILKGQEVKK